jgi:hypothetical protein
VSLARSSPLSCSDPTAHDMERVDVRLARKRGEVGRDQRARERVERVGGDLPLQRGEGRVMHLACPLQSARQRSEALLLVVEELDPLVLDVELIRRQGLARLATPLSLFDERTGGVECATSVAPGSSTSGNKPGDARGVNTTDGSAAGGLTDGRNGPLARAAKAATKRSSCPLKISLSEALLGVSGTSCVLKGAYLLMQHHYHSPLYKQAPFFPYPFKSTMSRIQRFLNSLTEGQVPTLIGTQ